MFKKQPLATAVAVASIAAVSQQAMAFDMPEGNNGAFPFYYHMGGFTVDQVDSATPCNPFYAGIGAAADPDCTYQAQTLIGQSDSTERAADVYSTADCTAGFDASGNFDPGNHYFEYAQNTIQNFFGTGSTQQNVFPDHGVPLPFIDCSINTNAAQKIVGPDDWSLVEFTYKMITFNSMIDWGGRTYTNAEGCSSRPTLTQFRAIDAANHNPVDGSGHAVGDTQVNNTAPNQLPAGCRVTGRLNWKYFTCDPKDPCGASGKAVPVPALAAATLGLGLVGITYLTSRRRQVGQ